jgi:hypothetical protein
MGKIKLTWKEVFNAELDPEKWYSYSSGCKVYMFGDALKLAKLSGYSYIAWDNKIFSVKDNQFILNMTVKDIK